MKNVWITGGTGFIGSHLVRELQKKNCAVHLFLRRPYTGTANVTWEIGDLSDQGQVLTSLKKMKPDVIVHLAAYGMRPTDCELKQTIMQNVWVPAMLVQQAKEAGVSTFIMLGSSSEYGESKEVLVETSPLLPQDLYGSSKAAGVTVARQLAQQLAMTFLCLRVFNVYGEGQSPASFSGYMMQQLAANERLAVSPCEQERDFIYVRDVVQAILKSMEVSGTMQEVINIGSGESITLRSYLEKVKTLLNSTSQIDYGAIPYRDGERMYTKTSIKKAKDLLNWEPNWTLTAGIKATLGEVSEHGNAKN